MRTNLWIAIVLVAATGCGEGSGSGSPVVLDGAGGDRTDTAVDDGVELDARGETAGGDTGRDTVEGEAGLDTAEVDEMHDTAPPPKRRVVFEGKDPVKDGYRMVVDGSIEGRQLESEDNIDGRVATGWIREVHGRDVFSIRGPIEELTVRGNIEVSVDGEIRKNGLQVREGKPAGDNGTVALTLHSSLQLLETNGRVSERMVAKYAANAFEEAGFGYRITYNFFPERPPDEKSNCSAGDAPQWWRKQIRTGQVPNVAKDANVLMLNANGGGCGAVGGKYGTTPARNIDEERPWKRVGTGDWQRNMHGTLHEIGHQLGARHDHDRDQEGQQHPGVGWNEEGPDGKTWWHRTPTTAGNGAPNLCGTAIKKRQSQANVKRHQTFAGCAIQMFEIADPD